MSLNGSQTVSDKLHFDSPVAISRFDNHYHGHAYLELSFSANQLDKSVVIYTHNK